MPTSLSLQIREMQGDFAEMQGEAKLTLAKSLNKLTVWVAPPYSRSREAMFPSREKPQIRGTRASVLSGADCSFTQSNAT